MHPTDTQSCDVLVVGAGPAGLTASYLATKAGLETIVLEQDPEYVGGISRTVSHNGFLFDIGGHRFFSKSRRVVDLWNEILPDDFIERPRSSRIYYGGKFYAYPLKAFEALANLGVLESAACLASYAYARCRPVRDPKTFHEWVRNEFGERLFSIFFKTYTEKVWGMSCDEISADWASQRIRGLNLGGAIRNALSRSMRGTATPGHGPVVKTLIESFRYPRRGPGMMWEAAAAKTVAQGGHVLLDRKLLSLSWNRAARRWTVAARRSDGTTELFSARHVISSAPIGDITTALSPKPLCHFNARALRYRDFLTVAVITKRRDVFSDNWIYIHDPAVKAGRIQNFRSWSPEMVPDPDLACLGLEYFCFDGDDLWSLPDQDLFELAKRDLALTGLVAPDEVVDACVVRQPKAYPVYDDAYRHHVSIIRLELARDYPTLHLVGRNGMHKYNNQDHAMMTAMLTVENILAGEPVHDVWAVNDDAEYHEEARRDAAAALASERLVPMRRAG